MMGASSAHAPCIVAETEPFCIAAEESYGLDGALWVRAYRGP
jgi:hypothetical protein